jgi:NADPH:quinone reductase-like Zn-dependent oxidoreductase
VYTEEDFVKNGKTYDIIFDTVGKKPKKEVISSLATNGNYVSTDSLDTAAERKEDLQFLSKLFDSGKYKAVIDKTFPLEKIVEAHRYVDQGKKKGNVVIRVSNERI